MIFFRWRLPVDFIDFDWYDFSYFQDVLERNELQLTIRRVLSPFTIPTVFSNELSYAIYDYCYGKQVNLYDEDRWKRNFQGEISGYLLETARYLQAYARDVNNNIDRDDTSKVTTTGHEKAGSADTRKTGNVDNTQSSDVSGSNQQQSTEELGDTLSVINNVTTSTNYLATANEESFSRGSVTETGQSDFAKNETNNIKMGVENGAQLSDKKDRRVTDTEGVKSPLTIASEESAFTFRDWFEPLYAIIDTYFTPGGGENYA